MLDRYLAAVYEDGGRELPRVDCWGLTRLARHELYGMPMLSSFGEVRHTSPRHFQRAYQRQVQAALEECEPFAGASLPAWMGRSAVHVARSWPGKGGCKYSKSIQGPAPPGALQDFLENFTRVIFYRDRILREQVGS